MHCKKFIINKHFPLIFFLYYFCVAKCSQYFSLCTSTLLAFITIMKKRSFCDQKWVSWWFFISFFWWISLFIVVFHFYFVSGLSCKKQNVMKEGHADVGVSEEQCRGEKPKEEKQSHGLWWGKTKSHNWISTHSNSYHSYKHEPVAVCQSRDSTMFFIMNVVIFSWWRNTMLLFQHIERMVIKRSLTIFWI